MKGRSSLQRRIDRYLLQLSVGSAVLAGLMLTVVMAGIQQRQSLQQLQLQADTIERQMLEQLTTDQPLAQVQRSLQVTAAANRVPVALLVNAQGWVIAANDGARVGARFERWMLQPISDAVWNGIWPCLVETQGRWHHPNCQQPFERSSGEGAGLGDSRWISMSRTPLALEGQGGLQTDALLLLSLDQQDARGQAIRTGLLGGGVGLVLVLLGSGSLVLVLRQGLVRHLVTLARTDHTTGQLNRIAWLEEMPSWLEAQKAQQQPVLVAIAGVDRFRQINDHHGHSTGDRLLRQLGQTVQAALQPGEWLARLSGDQYVLCIRGGTASLDRLRQLCSDVAATNWQAEPGEQLQLTLSIGVASSFGPAGWTLSRLLAQADRNLRLAKQEGGNQAICL